jgi:3-methyladenine DNA glycosylase AlkD
MNIKEKLFKLQDKKYQEMQFKIIPNIEPNTIIGVRTPELRSLAKELIKEDYKSFLNNLPHQYFDENQLHAFIISLIKDYDDCITYTNKFLPYVDNWAVCDIMSPKVFKKNKDKLINKIKTWSKSKNTYTCRFALGMLMSYFLDEDFKREYLEIPASIHSDEYYINMMIAWFYATSLAKQWDSTIPYLENNKLDKWIHNKTIQKAKESYRITQSQKEYLNNLKR